MNVILQVVKWVYMWKNGFGYVLMILEYVFQ